MAKKKPTRKNTKSAAVTKKKPAVNKRVTDIVITKTLNIHKLSIAVWLALGVAIVLLMAPVFHPVSLSFVTRDVILSSVGQNVLVPAERVLFDVDLRWLLGGLLAVPAIYSLLVSTRWKDSYEKAQKARIYMWRWVFFALTGAFMLKIAGLISGVEDLMALKLGESLFVFAMGFAWLSERQNEQAAVPVGSAYVMAWLSGLLAFGAVIASIIGTFIFGQVNLPWHAYALDAIVLFGFILMMLNLRLSNKKLGYAKDYAMVERNYVLILLLATIAFAGTLILAFQQ